MSIFIFSRSIHSGKTTELCNWCDQQKHVAGILMPDIDGSRKILDLGTKNIFDIECADPVKNKEPLTTIGKFHFYSNAFEKANNILQDALQQNPGWLIIDEAGKLELDGKGFYQSIIKAVEWENSNKNTGNLLITVRESLRAAVIAFFNLHNCRVISNLEDLK